MDQLIFEDRSTSDQNIAIWKDIQLIREELQIIRNDTNININNFVQVGKGLSSVIVLNILLAVLYFNYVVL